MTEKNDAGLLAADTDGDVEKRLSSASQTQTVESSDREDLKEKEEGNGSYVHDRRERKLDEGAIRVRKREKWWQLWWVLITVRSCVRSACMLTKQ